jgi:hypothetical protein
MSVVTLAQESLLQSGFYVPQFEVRIEGAGLPRDVLRDVQQLTYKDNIKEIDSFELTVNNWDTITNDFKYIGAETPETLAGATPLSQRYKLFEPCNKEVEIRMGYTDELKRRPAYADGARPERAAPASAQAIYLGLGCPERAAIFQGQPDCPSNRRP